MNQQISAIPIFFKSPSLHIGMSLNESYIPKYPTNVKWTYINQYFVQTNKLKWSLENIYSLYPKIASTDYPVSSVNEKCE